MCTRRPPLPQRMHGHKRQTHVCNVFEPCVAAAVHATVPLKGLEDRPRAISIAFFPSDPVEVVQRLQRFRPKDAVGVQPVLEFTGRVQTSGEFESGFLNGVNTLTVRASATSLCSVEIGGLEHDKSDVETKVASCSYSRQIRPTTANVSDHEQGRVKRAPIYLPP